MGPLAIALIGVLSAATGGAVTAFFKYLVDRQTTKTADWSNLAEAYSRQLADMAKAHGISMGSVEARLERLESELESEKEKSEHHFRRGEAAVRYAKLLRDWLFERFPSEDIPSVPDELQYDL